MNVDVVLTFEFIYIYIWSEENILFFSLFESVEVYRNDPKRKKDDDDTSSILFLVRLLTLTFFLQDNSW